MRFALAMIVMFVCVACEKTIKEARLPGVPTEPARASAVR